MELRYYILLAFVFIQNMSAAGSDKKRKAGAELTGGEAKESKKGVGDAFDCSCPITFSVFCFPFTLPCQHTFERETLLMNGGSNCPTCRREYSKADIPGNYNRCVQSIIRTHCDAKDIYLPSMIYSADEMRYYLSVYRAKLDAFPEQENELHANFLQLLKKIIEDIKVPTRDAFCKFEVIDELLRLVDQKSINRVLIFEILSDFVIDNLDFQNYFNRVFFEKLIALFNEGSLEEKKAIADVIDTLSLDNVTNQGLFQELDAISLLLPLVQECERFDVRTVAVGALASLVESHEGNKLTVLSSGIVPKIVVFLCFDTKIERMAAYRFLFSLSVNDFEELDEINHAVKVAAEEHKDQILQSLREMLEGPDQSYAYVKRAIKLIDFLDS